MLNVQIYKTHFSGFKTLEKLKFSNCWKSARYGAALYPQAKSSYSSALHRHHSKHSFGSSRSAKNPTSVALRTAYSKAEECVDTGHPFWHLISIIDVQTLWQVVCDACATIALWGLEMYVQCEKRICLAICYFYLYFLLSVINVKTSALSVLGLEDSRC